MYIRKVKWQPFAVQALHQSKFRKIIGSLPVRKTWHLSFIGTFPHLMLFTSHFSLHLSSVFFFFFKILNLQKFISTLFTTWLKIIIIFYLINILKITKVYSMKSKRQNIIIIRNLLNGNANRIVTINK